MIFSNSPHSWPMFLTGLLIVIYWLRVLQLVLRTRLTVGRAANFIPPEPLGRILRLVWIPVVVLWAIVPTLSAWLERPLPDWLHPMVAVDMGGGRIVAWAAFVVAAVAFALTCVCWVRMGTSWRMGIDPSEQTQLIFNGPYAYVRHPIYALSSLLMICTFIVDPSPLMIAVAALHLGLLQWEARREERYLLALHGESYANYTSQVGRFFPRVRCVPNSHHAGT